MSFNPHSIKHIARVLPDTPRGLVSDAFAPQNWAGVSETRCKELAQMSDYTPLGASFISHNVNDLDNRKSTKSALWMGRFYAGRYAARPRKNRKDACR